MTENALIVEGLTRHFGGVKAVDGVAMTVAPGELRAVIGPNGAGKTTFFNLLSGKIRPQEGRIVLQGRDITREPPHKRCRMGLGRTFQINNIFPNTTVRENIRLAVLAQQGRCWNMVSSAGRMVNRETEALADQVRLTPALDTVARELSYGDRRRLELAVTLAGKPSFLLLDEPTCGMSLGERPEIVALIRDLMEETGLTAILIEHDMDIVFTVADRVSVMHRGRLIADDEPHMVAADPEVQRVYLGEGDHA